MLSTRNSDAFTATSNRVPTEQYTTRSLATLPIPWSPADSLLRIRALSLLGNIDLNIDTRAGIEDWQEVLAIATSISDAKWQNRARGELGLLAGVNGDLASAALALQQSIVKAESLGDVPGQLHFSIWLANGMAHNGRADSALRILDRATALAEKSGHDMPLDLYTARITALTSLPEEQILKGRETARSVLNTALAQARASGIVVAEGALLNQAGQLELDAGNTAAAEVAITRALEIAKKANLPREEAEALRRLSALYRKTHQPAKALNCNRPLHQRPPACRGSIRPSPLRRGKGGS